MKGITVFIEKAENNSLRLVLNDVESTTENDNPNWKHSVLFTSNNYDENDLKNLSLSKEQFAEIGENIIIRLLALNSLTK